MASLLPVALFIVSQQSLAIVAESSMIKVVLRPQLVEVAEHDKGSRSAVVKRDRLSQVARLLSVVNRDKSAALQRESEYLAMIEKYVDGNSFTLGVGFGDLQLMPAATLITSDVAFFKFRVFRADIPIEDASMLFRFKHGRLVQVVNYSFHEATLVHEGREELPDRQLREILQTRFGQNHYQAIGHVYRVTVRDNRYHLLKVRVFQQKFADRATVQIDVHTGKVYEYAPSRYTIEGLASGVAHASLYSRWYGGEATTRPLRGLGISIGLQTVHTDSRGHYQLPTLMAEIVPRVERMVGAKVAVINHSGPKIAIDAVQQRGAWHLLVGRDKTVGSPNDKLVAQSMVFYHVDKVFRVAADYIGSSWFDVPLQSHTNLRATCNAYWDSSKSTINFASGDRNCANTGLIADVIYHEWGHGLDDKTGGIVDGSLSEGFGDIISMLMTRSNVVGPGFFVDGRAIRDLEPDKVYPRDYSPDGRQVHSNGLIIAGTFWDMFKAFRQRYSEQRALDILRRFAFQMIFTAERFTDVYDALLIIDDNDTDLTNGTPNFCLINEPFARHGLAELADRCQ